jgi:hypothetical protein
MFDIRDAFKNGCQETVPRALRYLAENERPIGGEQPFNSMHLYQLADEIEAAYREIAEIQRKYQSTIKWFPVLKGPQSK